MKVLLKALIVTFAAALVLAGCGDSGNSIAEEVLENRPGVSGVQVGDDGSSATIEVQGDGTSASIAGEGAEIPDGFPVPFPPNETVASVIQSSAGSGQNSVSVAVTFPADRWEEILTFYQNWLDSLPDDRFMNVTGGASPTAQITSAKAGVSVTLVANEDDVKVIATANSSS